MNPCSEIPLNDDGQFSTLAMPLTRRIYPQMIANQLVSVQPLSAPKGLLYYNQQETPRKKIIRKKKYRSIDDPWEEAS